MASSQLNSYKAVAASQTASQFGSNAGGSDFISHVLVTPASTSPGVVTLLDGSASFTIFAGGTDSVPDLRPFLVPVLAYAQTGPWKVTTGANVSAVIVGAINA